MNKAFTTHLLVQGSDGQAKLIDAKINLHPGRSFSPDQGKTVLLAGGFSSIFPETGFLLSSTLQLNADLTSASHHHLEQIAIAEVEREQSQVYRSYTVDADTRLCVVSASATSLDDFVETYGGVLSIEPLLVKGSDSKYPTVTEMSVERGPRAGISVQYGVRSPLDASLCTYCGACGASCPENCISPNLYFDFSLCSFCKKCEEVCPVGAVEIYGLEYQTLHVPALLLLDGCEVEGASGCGSVYREASFDSYLKKLYPFQVDEIVSIEPSLCHHHSGLGTGCTLCHDACQYGAVSLRSGVAIDPLLCEECGDCVSVCPTGVLQYERFTDYSFINYFSQIELPYTTVILGDTDNLHQFWWRHRGERFDNTFFLASDRVEFFTLFHFLYLYSQGVSRIVVVQTSGIAGKAMLREAQLANIILTALFSCESPVVVVEKLDSEVLKKTVSHALSTFYVMPEWQNRRVALKGVLEYLLQLSGKTPGFKGNRQTPFATISCDTKLCTQCMSCINVCKIKSMSTDETEMKLSHLAALCIGCGLCVHICPENALQISNAFQFTQDFFIPRTLAIGDPMSCKKCGKVFGTRKSFDRVMSILASKESVDTSHFEYCDTCRVVRLFEEHA